MSIEHQINNNTFDPETDRVLLLGNRYPLSTNSPLEMKPTESDSTIYELKVEFLSRLSGNEVEYTFRLSTRTGILREDMPRVARIPENEFNMTPLYFNSYAW